MRSLRETFREKTIRFQRPTVGEQRMRRILTSLGGEASASEIYGEATKYRKTRLGDYAKGLTRVFEAGHRLNRRKLVTDGVRHGHENPSENGHVFRLRNVA